MASEGASGAAPLPSAARRWLFRAAALFLVVGTVEAASWLYLWVRHGIVFRHRWIRELQEEAARTMEDPGDPGRTRVPYTLRVEALHPYLGYVWDTGQRRGDPRDLRSHGFMPRAGRLASRCAPGEVHLAVLGGSVAESFGNGAGVARLMADLKQTPRYRGARFHVAVLGLAGFKQPQQLLALAYVLSLGAHFDLVVNLDGLNDITLPVAENVSKGVYPYFPRSWGLRVGGLEHRQRMALGRLALAGERRRRFSRLFLDTPLGWSVTGNLIWRRWDGRMLVELAEIQSEIMNAPATDGLLASGPGFAAGDEEEMLTELAAAWARASREMDALSKSQGARYVHVLQPNQYDPGRKPMGEAERAVAIDERSDLARLVAAGYPLLRREGSRLAESGVEFHDLTGIFEKDPRPMYRDVCCHFNWLGNDALGAAIAAAMTASDAATVPGAESR